MSKREWKPGDVAMVNGTVCIRQGKVWEHGDERAFPYEDDPALTVRPLIVIDPEDRQQVADLRHALPLNPTVDEMQAVLREFANPTPPKPDEPQGLGAVVEDAEGVPWVRCENADRVPHWYARNKMRENYADITVVRVLSEGVTP